MNCGARISRLEAERIWDAAVADTEARAEEMPTEIDALHVMGRAYQRLRDLGWNDAIYCPKDGTVFDVIEAGSTGIHACHYMGEWPNGGWWVHDDGDLWPSRPILFRAASGTEARRAETAETGSVHDGPTAQAGTPNPRQVSSSKGETQALASRDEPRT